MPKRARIEEKIKKNFFKGSEFNDKNKKIKFEKRWLFKDRIVKKENDQRKNEEK